MKNDDNDNDLTWDDVLESPVSEEKLLQIQETLCAFFKTLDEWDRKRDRT